jgi:hypothetical protein
MAGPPRSPWLGRAQVTVLEADDEIGGTGSSEAIIPVCARPLLGDPPDGRRPPFSPGWA